VSARESGDRASARTDAPLRISSAASYRPAFAALHNPASAFRTLVAAAGSSLPPATWPMQPGLYWVIVVWSSLACGDVTYQARDEGAIRYNGSGTVVFGSPDLIQYALDKTQQANWFTPQLKGCLHAPFLRQERHPGGGCCALAEHCRSSRPTQVRAAVTPTGSTRCVTNHA
jgi:hypothetical protein